MVTPEAVALEFETAGVGSRLLAFIIDWAVLGSGIVAMTLVLGAVGSQTTIALPDWVLITFVTLLYAAWMFGYFIAFETLWRGRTLGKAALGLRVVTTEGGPIRLRHALIRTFLGLIDWYLAAGCVAVISILTTQANQRLGDLAAGTLVLRERSGVAAAPVPVAFAPPPGLEPYARLLDTSRIGAAEYQAVRGFLLRRFNLVPAARASLATRLATSLAAMVQPPPPAGLAPELFLQTLAAAHQQRQRVLSPVPSPAGQPGQMSRDDQASGAGWDQQAGPAHGPGGWGGPGPNGQPGGGWGQQPTGPGTGGWGQPAGAGGRAASAGQADGGNPWPEPIPFPGPASRRDPAAAQAPAAGAAPSPGASTGTDTGAGTPEPGPDATGGGFAPPG
jgi:uncharacterized RDD family membrane protein YckC